MAKRNVSSEYFGVVGLGDPMSSFAQKTIRVSWDFGKTNVRQNASGDGPLVIPVATIPRGFCVDRISVIQTKPMSSALTLNFGLASTDASTVGSNFALVASGEMLRASQAVTNGLFVSADDVLCMVVPVGSGTFTDGAFDVCVHGFETFAEAPATNETGCAVYRKSLQTRENVGGGQFPLD